MLYIDLDQRKNITVINGGIDREEIVMKELILGLICIGVMVVFHPIIIVIIAWLIGGIILNW